MTTAQELAQDTKTVDALIDAIESRDDVSPERGPYSFSRLIDTCDQWFKFKYIDELDGQQLTRYERGFGSAVHKALEMDLKLRIRKDKTVSPQRLIDVLSERDPDMMEYQRDLEDSVARFRNTFDVNPDAYIASEKKWAVDFGMQPVESYDDGWYRGIVDYVELDDDGLLTMTDFKNYPSIHSKDTFNDRFSGTGAQLLGYAAMALAHTPSAEAVQYQVYYTRFGTVQQCQAQQDDYDWETTTFSRDWIRHQWWPYMQRKMLARERTPVQLLKPQPSRKRCQYCEYTEQCPVGQDLDKEIIAENEDQAEEMLRELIVLNERRKRVRDALKTFAKEHGMIQTDDGEYYGYQAKQKTNFDYKEIFRIAYDQAGQPDDIADFIDWVGETFSLHKSSIDKFKSNLNDDLLDYFQQYAQDTETRDRLDKSFR